MENAAADFGRRKRRAEWGQKDQKENGCRRKKCNSGKKVKKDKGRRGRKWAISARRKVASREVGVAGEKRRRTKGSFGGPALDGLGDSGRRRG